MDYVFKILLGLAGLIACVFLIGWFIWTTVAKSEDPARVTFKWIITGIVLAILIYVGLSFNRSGFGAAFVIPIVGAVFGVFLGILWAPHLGSLLASPLTAFYDGGSAQVEVRPFYAIARAKQKRGHYLDAITEVRKQLERFSEDYEGWMFLAEIYAENLKDNEAAQKCIQEILRHQSHTPKNVAYALNRSADWHLVLASDRQAARESLEQVIVLSPGSEWAHAAEQRIAHLTSDKMLADAQERPRLALKQHTEHIGLRGEIADPRPPAEEPAAAASRLVNHLAEFPQDAEAREELAKIYADDFLRIELAADQIEALILTPGAAPKEVARWLNMLADFHLRVGQDRSSAEATLHRIVDRYPKTALAAQAETRLAYIETELYKNKKSLPIKLGSYEGNIGLRGQVPRKPD